MDKQERDDMPATAITRAAYMRREISFVDYYGAIVEALGESQLRRWLPVNHRTGETRTPAQWRTLLADDEHLNNVPLRQWDRLDYLVREQARRNLDAVAAISGSRAWSLSDTVCTMKAVARRYAEVGA
jgi:hypothetical protein